MGTTKIPLDQYYTPLSLSKQCIDTVYALFGEVISEAVEPSAGNGSFSTQLPHCLAYDIEPKHPAIIKQDFLQLILPYKPGRLLIGNPPFGERNALSVKFFKHAVHMGDYIAFILPVSQYNNTQQMFEFDLVHSEMLPLMEYSGVKLLCCFNIYKRPAILHKKAQNYKLKDVLVTEYRRGGTYQLPVGYDFGMCAWGSGLGKEVVAPGQYAQENYFYIRNEAVREEVLVLIRTTKWISLYPYIGTPKIQTWKIYKYLKEMIPALY